jgi:tRNA (mo5U34)-methyltransferase
MVSPPASPLDWPELENLGDPARLRDRVARVPVWFHEFELPGGVWTKGYYKPAPKLHRFCIPARLDGQRVLDVGAWDGFFSFECERRGAASVTSMDIWDPASNATSEGYAVAHRAVQSRAVPIRASVHDLDLAVHGQFDLVLYLGVLYHLTNPFESLQKLRAVTKGTLIVETASDMHFTSRPALAFYPGFELNGDGSNWFAPNASALVGMCKAAGFRDAKVMWSMGPLTRTTRAAVRFARNGENPIRGLARGRLIVHAFT